MKTPKWSELREQLRQRQAAPPPRAVDAFWADFQARAALAPQPGSAAGVNAPSAAWHRWGVAAAALVLAAVLAMPALLSPGSGPEPAAMELSQVRQIDVFVDYDSLLIMQDEENGGTLIWVAGATAAPLEDG